jgi:DNA-binding NarL/FixJ family response regulator
MIKIILAEEQRLLRERISSILSSVPDFEIVGVTGQGDELLELCRIHSPNLVLLGVKLPNTNERALLELIKQAMPNIKVIILTALDEEKNILEALSNGASGYIIKDATSLQIVSSLRAINGGRFVMQESFYQFFQTQIRQKQGKATSQEARFI